MIRNLFPDHTDWTEATCYYVAAFHHTRMALIAGPYRSRAEAEEFLPAAQDWALRSGRDAAAADYVYAVHEAWNGHYRSILGEWTLLGHAPGDLADVVGYLPANERAEELRGQLAGGPHGG